LLFLFLTLAGRTADGNSNQNLDQMRRSTSQTSFDRYARAPVQLGNAGTPSPSSSPKQEEMTSVLWDFGFDADGRYTSTDPSCQEEEVDLPDSPWTIEAIEGELEVVAIEEADVCSLYFIGIHTT
jgi:hypothetical protein